MPGPIFPGTALLVLIVAYLLLLFAIGWLGERKFEFFRSRGWDRYIYVFAGGVYCTSWTFYGCIGNAAQNGISFLGLFIGPSVFALGWWFVLRRIVRVCRANNITSVPDFLSVRYGNHPWIGPVATVLLVVGSVPYISLQLRAVAISFDLIAVPSPAGTARVDPMLLVSICMGAFALFFGGRYLDFTKRQGGLLTAVAVESIVKIVIFMGAGIFVCWGVFGGPGEIFGKILSHPDWRRLATLGEAPGNGYSRWLAYVAISAIDVILLPRQFHVFVVQNGDEKHIRTAMWMFPLYLLLINLFVVPIAFGGLILGLPASMADKYILSIPMLAGEKALSLLVFLGGFSAATAMVMVSSVALGKMIANNLLIPGILKARRGFHDYGYLLAAARASMLAVIVLGYLYARLMSRNMVLMEIGIISFVAVAQFGPAVFGGLYWKGASARGALLGISAGFAAWFYTMVVPAMVKAGIVSGAILERGPFGVAALRPTGLLGIASADPVGNAVFWTLFVNVLGFVAGSVLFAPSREEDYLAGRVAQGSREPAPAPAFPFPSPAPGAHYLSLEEIEKVVTRYAGSEKRAEVEEVVREIREIKMRGETREAVIRQMDLPQRLERILTGSIGAISARNVLRDMLPLSLDDARTLVESFREMEKDLATTREEVTHKEEEIRARERFLASVVRSIDDGVVSLDFEGRITTVNEGACRLFRRAEAEMVGRDFNFLVRDTRYREKRRIIARSTYRTGHWRGEVEIVRKDGSVAPALLSTAKIIDERGKPIGFVSSFKDLTETRAMQHKMIQTEKLASLGQMAAGVAHEVRNPLGSIKMSLRLLRDDLRGAETLEVVEHIRDAVGSMEIIVNELLDYTRDITLQLDEYDVGKIARAAVFGLEEESGRKGISVEIDDSCGPLTAMVDGVRLKQVLTNVVKNALDAARPGGGRVAVRLSGGARPGAGPATDAGADGYVRVTVEDDGPGMSEAEMEKMFQPFYTTKAQGVGLGMSIVKRLVELHGGEVRVASTAGAGTAVTVSLPRFPYGGGGGGG
ncbi:MAG: sensor histidine kinase [Deltaproteobacteria bacterium]